MLRYRYTAYRDTQAAEAKVVCRCDLCGEAICEGYDYYRIGVDSYCEDCVRSSIRVAGEEDDDAFYRNEIDRAAFAAGLKRLMERESVTASMLAEWVDTRKQTIFEWRSGRSLPRRHYLTRLEKTFRTRVDEIVRIGKETEKNG